MTKHTDPQTQTAEDFLRDLVAIPTITGEYTANHDALEYVHAFLEKKGMHSTRHSWNGVESLVATTRPTKTPAVFLMAHLDVVAAPPEAFELKKQQGRYTGRGVLDMKCALAAYLAAAEEMGNTLHDYDFGIMVVTDEEIGGFDGAQRLAEAGYIPQVMVIPDGGLNDWNMERLAKGLWWTTLEATGTVAHGSRPWEGKNPIETLLAAWAEIRALFGDMHAESSTVSLDVIQAGNTINQIPGSASMSLDMRFASKAEQIRIYNAVQDIANNHGIKVVTEVEADPMTNDPSDPLIQAYKETTEQIIGRPVRWVTSNAGNDGRFFAARGVPCAIAYPVGGGHHSDNEWIAEESLEQLKNIVVSYLKKVAV